MFNELLSQLSTAQVGALDIELVNVIDFKELVIKFGFNLLVTFVVVYFIYAKNSRRKDFFFSYFAISTAIFALCFLLESVKLELGIALGLFAIFGIIRYRTDTIPIKEMTYLFVIIGLAVINALSSKNVSFLELLFTNVAILGTLWILELILMLRQEASLDIVYEKIENINLNKRDELVRDIQERTGIKIKRIEIEEINFMRDIARIRVFHDITESNGKGNAKK
ncbi:DUF4956 domain-containing protein [Maribellus sp. YY47]|uniref:DUF4956 domain-containing protein n=1 Tax=Maribellus sp. YY47 TaxID=2929486 RepID=UPI002000E594|nr:DUF4956 domain-containing protein [Maribellus sp. YY47]MCK3685868.1 DUF4956 domain-containing protein [Maribellus sp. YY47]